VEPDRSSRSRSRKHAEIRNASRPATGGLSASWSKPPERDSRENRKHKHHGYCRHGTWCTQVHPRFSGLIRILSERNSTFGNGFDDLSLGFKQQLGPIRGGFDVSLIASVSFPTGANLISSHGYDPTVQLPWSRSPALTNVWLGNLVFLIYSNIKADTQKA